MSRLPALRLVALCAILVFGALPASAAGPIGVVLLHGKTGMPGAMGKLAAALGAAGYAVETPEMCWSKKRIFDKTLDGFGEAFRRLSWDDVGPRAILSRALAGTVGAKIVVALPGSPRALALAVERILAPLLPHAMAVARGRENHRGDHR